MLLDNYYFIKSPRFDNSIWGNEKPYVKSEIDLSNVNFHDIASKKIYEQLSTEEKKALLADYRDKPSKYNFNLFSLNLKEGILRSYPADTVIKYVKSHLHIPDLAITKDNSDKVDVILVAVHNVGNNIDTLIRTMNLCGYYLAVPTDVAEIKPNKIARLQFEPRNQDNCIHPNTIGMLYHWTRPELVNKILKNGLVPRSKNSFFSYPERIYVVKDSIPQAELMDLGAMLCTSLNFEKYENGQSFDQTLSLIQINPKLLKQDFAFFIDPNYSDYGLYCLENIPPDAIEHKANKTFSFIGNN